MNPLALLSATDAAENKWTDRQSFIVWGCGRIVNGSIYLSFGVGERASAHEKFFVDVPQSKSVCSEFVAGQPVAF